ncbi:hypothetical protein AMTR_s00026p00160050, partial [Amborella trichopoda]
PPLCTPPFRAAITSFPFSCASALSSGQQPLPSRCFALILATSLYSSIPGCHHLLPIQLRLSPFFRPATSAISLLRPHLSHLSILLYSRLPSPPSRSAAPQPFLPASDLCHLVASPSSQPPLCTPPFPAAITSFPFSCASALSSGQQPLPSRCCSSQPPAALSATTRDPILSSATCNSYTHALLAL